MFFFQAEDGIRDIGVTGVQTCALPILTIRVWPSGWVCHAVRAPGSKVTLAPATRAGSGARKSGSTRTEPVKYSAGPLPDGCEPFRLISILGEIGRASCRERV